MEISEERQRQAVRLAETTNRPSVEIARRIWVSLSEFYSWRKQFNRRRSTNDSPASGKGSVRRGPGNIAPRVQNSIEEISEERQREPSASLKKPTGLRWKLRVNSGCPCTSSTRGGTIQPAPQHERFARERKALSQA